MQYEITIIYHIDNKEFITKYISDKLIIMQALYDSCSYFTIQLFDYFANQIEFKIPRCKNLDDILYMCEKLNIDYEFIGENK